MTDTDSSRRVRTWRFARGREVAGAAVVYAAASVATFWSTWGHSPKAHFIGVGGDAQAIMWYLTWVPHALAHGWNPLVTHHLNYPDGVNVMWNTAMPLIAIIVWPITRLGGPVLAYNTLMTAGPAASAVAAFVATRRLVGHRGGALAAGLLYGFSPYVISQAFGHVHLVLVFVPPLLLLALDELLVRQHRSPIFGGIVLGALAGAQFLIAEEILATSALVAGLGVGLLAIRCHDRFRGHAAHAAKGLAVAAMVVAVVSALPVAVQFAGPHRVTSEIQPRNVFVSDLVGPVVPTFAQRFSPAVARRVSAKFTPTTIGIEWNAYLGFPLVALLLVAAVSVRDFLLRFSALLAVLVFVLSLGPNLHVAGRDTGTPLPWRLIEHGPLMGHVLPNRLMVYVFLFAGIAVASFVAHLAGRWRVVGWTPVIVALLALAPKVPFASWDADVPRYFRGATSELRTGSVVLVAPYASGPNNSAPMLWQAVDRMRYRMPEGYFIQGDARGRARVGPPPSTTSDAMHQVVAGATVTVDDQLRSSVLSDLRRWRVRTVVTRATGEANSMRDFFTAVLHVEPEHKADVLLWPTGIDP